MDLENRLLIAFYKHRLDDIAFTEHRPGVYASWIEMPTTRASVLEIEDVMHVLSDRGHIIIDVGPVTRFRRVTAAGQDKAKAIIAAAETTRPGEP